MEKISVKEYLENNELLEISEYISYANKVNIVDSIMKQVCVVIDNTYSINSLLLDRVKSQIFIECCTNLNLTILEDGLDGYDLLVKNKCLNNILSSINDEYKELNRLLDLRINDYLRDKASVKGILDSKINYFIEHIRNDVLFLTDKINNIDVKSIVENISFVIDKMSKK